MHDQRVINLIKRLLVAVCFYSWDAPLCFDGRQQGCDETQKIKCRKIWAITNTIELGGELRPPGNELRDWQLDSQ